MTCSGKSLGTRGFTLVELLVVVSIIVLLIAILLPMLSSAKTASRMVICQANLKQLADGTIAYAIDHDGYFAERQRTSSRYVGGFRDSKNETWSLNFLEYMDGALNNLPEVVLCPNGDNTGQTWAPAAKPHWRLSDYAYWPSFYERVVGGVNTNASNWVAQDANGQTIKTARTMEAAADSPIFGDVLFERPASANGWYVATHPQGNSRGTNGYVYGNFTPGNSINASEPIGGSQANLDASVQWHHFSEFENATVNILGSGSKYYWVEPR